MNTTVLSPSPFSAAPAALPEMKATATSGGDALNALKSDAHSEMPKITGGRRRSKKSKKSKHGGSNKSKKSKKSKHGGAKKSKKSKKSKK